MGFSNLSSVHPCPPPPLPIKGKKKKANQNLKTSGKSVVIQGNLLVRRDIKNYYVKAFIYFFNVIIVYVHIINLK